MKYFIGIIGIIAGVYIGMYFMRGASSAPSPVVPNNVQSATVTTRREYGTPSRLIIPMIGVDADVENVGLDARKNMDVPKKDENVGWYELGVVPGVTGNAVVAGHLDTKTGAPAVFYRLSSLKKGDVIQTVDNNENKLTFVVTRIQKYPYDQFPLQEVFGAGNQQNLNLITCTGDFDRSAKNYSDRIVVYSKLKQ